ncbi:hypothetical protein HP556_24950 [Tardiphaga robiniae]|nr:hypothetical protein [Tardiphaga robiniae]NUU44384.1 hypothetical protein [Tardiphaga robiniae]
MQTDGAVKQSIEALTLLLAGSPYEIAARLRGLPVRTRADIAFGRLRRAGIKPERLLAIYLAIVALIEEDPGAVRTKEFRLVQVAKAAHRLASGYHRIWESEDWQGRRSRIELHKFARSSGQILRRIGAMIEERSEFAVERHLAGVLAFKRKRYGPHPALPEAKPLCNKLEG